MACEHMQTGADIFLNRRPDGKCRICRHEIYKAHYFANKEKVLEKAKQYRAKNPEKVKKIKAKWISEKKERKDAICEIPAEVKKIRVIYARKIRNLIAKINETIRAYRKYRSDVSARYRNDERHSSGNCGS